MFIPLSLFVIVALVAIAWQLWYKAGYSGWWGLLMVFPPFGIISLGVLAFSRWPVHEALSNIRRRRDRDLFD